jgi:selenocysteine lyase/cysteine desulfurase
MKQDFCLTNDTYLLSHSVGRPLKTAKAHFDKSYLSPWQDSNKEPWAQWLPNVEHFTLQLAKLFNSDSGLFCPQVNLSSGLTKLLMSHPRLKSNPKVLMSEIDFPSMGFAVKASVDADLHFIPKHEDITDINVWQSYIDESIDLVFISHAYSNTGQLSPVEQIVQVCKKHKCLSLVDVAQSVGVIPLDLQQVNPDFLIGSSVKWLCGGPGAAYLWVNKTELADCQPKDVGWFSHENPFEFDIHHYKDNASALKFWGGTPSVAPYVFASHSMEYFNKLGVKSVNQHNRHLQKAIIDAFSEEVVSPLDENKRSGTIILSFADNQKTLDLLSAQGISVDARHYGLRVSPHVYNTIDDITRLIMVLKA